MAITFVSESNAGNTNGTSCTVNIDTSTLSSGVIVVFVVAGRQAGNMTGATLSVTLGGSGTGWVESLAETINAASVSGIIGAWTLLNPTSSASIALAASFTGGTGGQLDTIGFVAGLYSGVGSIGTVYTVDNDGGTSTSDTMTNAPGTGNVTVGSWSHGSNISSVTSGTLRGTINNNTQSNANGCLAFIEGSTIAFSSGSTDSNIGVQLELVAAGGAAGASLIRRPNLGLRPLYRR